MSPKLVGRQYGRSYHSFNIDRIRITRLVASCERLSESTHPRQRRRCSARPPRSPVSSIFQKTMESADRFLLTPANILRAPPLSLLFNNPFISLCRLSRCPYSVKVSQAKGLAILSFRSYCYPLWRTPKKRTSKTTFRLRRLFYSVHNF